MVEVYAHKFLPDYYIESGVSKLWREEDCISISSARLTAGVAGLVKKSAGKLSLTKKGANFLQPENRLHFSRQFFCLYN